MDILYLSLFILFLPVAWILYQKTIRDVYVPRIAYHKKSNDIITFNINKFPWSNKSLGVLTMLHRYSIIFLQECFDETNGALEYTFSSFYIARGTMKGLNLFNSGLVILSKYPILESEFHKYKNYNGCSLDCLSEKGFLSVLLQLDHGEKIRVINTHLQSSDYEKYDKQALLQLEQLLDYTSTLQHKFIIGGDFNMDSRLLSHHMEDIPSTALYVPVKPTIFIDFQQGLTSNVMKDGYEGMVFDYFITCNVPLEEPATLFHTYSDHNPVASKIKITK